MQICQGIGLNLVKCLRKLSFKWKFLVNFLVHQFGLVCYCKTNVGLQPTITLNHAPSTWLCRWWSHLNSCRASTVWSWAIKMRRFPQRENVWSSTMLNVRWYVLFSEKRVDFQKTELFLVNKKINLRNSRLVVQGFSGCFHSNMKQSVTDHSSTKGTILQQTSIILNTWMIHDLK